MPVALTRPSGVPERRHRRGPLDRGQRGRPAAPDHATTWRWFRQAFEQPSAHGLRPVAQRKAIGAWEPDDSMLSPGSRAWTSATSLEAAGFKLTATSARRRTVPRFEARDPRRAVDHELAPP